MAFHSRSRAVSLVIVAVLAAAVGAYFGWVSLQPDGAGSGGSGGSAGSAGSGSAGPALPPTPAPVTSTATATAAHEPADKQTPPTPAPDKAQEAFDAMTQEERLGQLVMPAVTCGGGAAAESFVAEHHIGSVVFLGDCWSGDAVKAEAARLVAAGGSDLILAVDQEGGQVQRVKGGGVDTIPSGTTQGEMATSDLEAAAQGWGEQLKAVGVNYDLAPVVDTVDLANRNANAPIGALNRDYGLDAAGNAAHAQAFVRGMTAAGVGTSIKHFPGLGRVTGNTDYTTSGIEDDTTTATDATVAAFGQVLEEAPPTGVMVGLATYTQIDPDNPAAFSKAVVTDLLRGQLGWDGLVLSDSLTAQAAVHVAAKDRAVKFIAAGGDIALFGSVSDAQAALDGLVAAVQADPDLAAQADAAALRVLRAKDSLGLLG